MQTLEQGQPGKPNPQIVISPGTEPMTDESYTAAQAALEEILFATWLRTLRESGRIPTNLDLEEAA